MLYLTGKALKENISKAQEEHQVKREQPKITALVAHYKSTVHAKGEVEHEQTFEDDVW
jgi:hypothetical protein